MTLIIPILAAAVGLGDFTSAMRADLERRIEQALAADTRVCEVSGTVTCAGPGFFFIQRGDDGLKIAVGGAAPVPGSTVKITGRPSLEGGRVIVVADRWESTGTAELPVSVRAGRDELSEYTRDGGVNWRRVTVEGRVIGRTETGFAIDVDGLPVTVQSVRGRDLLHGEETFRPLVRVTGVVELILDESTLFGRNRWVIGVKLAATDAADVEIVPDATYVLNRRDRHVRFAVAALIALLVIGLGFFAVLLFRQRRRHFRTATIMAERKRMADDIHDTIEQHLVGAGMLIQIGRDKEARDVLVRAKAELRDIIWGLKNDDMMRLSPAAMLRDLAKIETKKGLFRVSQKLTGLPESLPGGQMRDLSLIVREAIGNAVKHGGAKKIAISSDPVADGGWLLRIANDGRPFDPAGAPGAAEGHFGLEGMRERARRLGGTVSISVERGWTVIALSVK